jgi:diguanylate cyclase (GGDEF)-like protein
LLVLLYIPAIAVLLLSMAKERLEYESRQSALTDPLTLLPNRRSFFQNAEAIATHFTAIPLSCLLFDLDRFKQINDRHGHHVGDYVLQVFAHILGAHLRDSATGRLGGEEFAALITASHAEALALAERIKQDLEKSSIMLVDAHVQATVSVGCATAVGASVAELLTRADRALYQAKARGRNAIVSASPDH